MPPVGDRPPNSTDGYDTAETVARHSYGKLVAFLAARTRDLAGAEDALADAFAAALAEWPRVGVPDNPEAWLMRVAARKAIDASRRRRSALDAQPDLRLLTDMFDDAGRGTEIPDRRLALMLACAHPAIEPGIRAPLILQTVLGFDAAAIASAFLVSPATMGQRLVRAKAKIKQAGIPFQIPEKSDLPDRIEAVLDAIYAAFAEGWTDPAGTEIRRRNLAEEALWLGGLVAILAPDEPEALGLQALMLFAEARRRARRDADGNYVPLADQDPALWDGAMTDRAEALLLRASTMGRIGRYQLEAAVQSAHAIRRRDGRSDWAAIEQLYDALFALTGSPVVAINRAVAVAEARGADAGFAALEGLAGDVRLAGYQPYWAARAELLSRMNEKDAALAAYQQAIGLETDPAVRSFLQRRCEALNVRPA